VSVNSVVDEQRSEAGCLLPEERRPVEDHCDRLLECGVGVDDYSNRVVVARSNLARDVDVSEQ